MPAEDSHWQARDDSQWIFRPVHIQGSWRDKQDKLLRMLLILYTKIVITANGNRVGGCDFTPFPGSGSLFKAANCEASFFSFGSSWTELHRHLHWIKYSSHRWPNVLLLWTLCKATVLDLHANFSGYPDNMVLRWFWHSVYTISSSYSVAVSRSFQIFWPKRLAYSAFN